jgi:hypothetical protein
MHMYHPTHRSVSCTCDSLESSTSFLTSWQHPVASGLGPPGAATLYHALRNSFSCRVSQFIMRDMEDLQAQQQEMDVQGLAQAQQQSQQIRVRCL